VKRNTKYLVASIYSCEHLPFPEPSLFEKTSKMDVEVTVEVGTKKMASQVVTIEQESKDDLDSGKATFNVEIWLPVELPTISDLVKYTVRDKSNVFSEPLLVAIYRTSFKDIQNGFGNKPYYANMYGAQVSGDGGASIPMVRGWGKDAMELKYNMFPDQFHAPCFRGRILLKQRVEDDLPLDMKSGRTKKILHKTDMNASHANLTQHNHPSATKFGGMMASASMQKMAYQPNVSRKGKPFRRHMKEGTQDQIKYPEMR
jgi:hypothetical protein